MGGRVYDSYEASHYVDSSPLFRFGFGLSYTSFAYSDLHVVAGNGGVLWQVSLTVKNTGNHAAAEVVQVYIQDPAGLPFIPYWKRMVGFGRVNIPAGGSSVVSIHVLR